MEHIIVGIIVAAAAVAVVYFAWRNFTGRGGCGSCGKKSRCPYSDDAEQK